MTAVLALSLVLAQAAVQQPADGTGSIAGQVVDAGSGRPIANAIVTLDGLPGAKAGRGGDPLVTPPGTSRVLTGRDGRFEFSELPQGNYGVTALKPGYSYGAYGRRRPSGPSERLTLAEGQRESDVAILLWRRGVISGRVVDEAGEPLVGTMIRAFARQSADRRFGAVAMTQTDDRGMYRLPPLDAGNYVVGVVPRVVSGPVTLATQGPGPGRPAGYVEIRGPPAPGTPSAIQVGDQSFGLSAGSPVPKLTAGSRLALYPPAFYPSAPDAAHATVIRLSAGEERDGIDLQLTPAPSVMVSGLVSGLADAGGLPVRLIGPLASQIALDGELPATVTDGFGNFTFPAVAPGDYRLVAATPRFDPRVVGGVADPHFADMPITVGGSDIEGVALTMRPAPRVSGRFEFEGSRERPSGESVRVAVEQAAGPSLLMGRGDARPSEDGFESGPHAPGRYYVRVPHSPAGWMFKSATLNGRDVADTPFDLRDANITQVVITFTDRWSGLSGTASDAAGTPDPSAAVVVFPTDQATWGSAGANPRRVRSARVSTNGQFGFTGLPPGDYFVAAITDVDPAEWRDPEFLAMLAQQAERITIREGERPAQPLTTLTRQ